MRLPLIATAVVLVCLGLAPSGAVAQERDALERSLSPLSPDVVERLRTIARAHPRMRDDVLAKVGDSMSVNWGFMSCFGAGRVELSGRGRLGATIDHFRGGGVVFERRSLAAGVGWSVPALVRGGERSPVLREVFSVFPRFALVMLGTNDVETGPAARFGRGMWRLLSLLASRGVIPVVSTAPPRPERWLDARIMRFNAVTRGLADGLGLPLVDLNAELVRLPHHGLMPGATQTRTRLIGQAQPDACNFTEDGLRYGTNVRNLLNLLMLDRLRRYVLAGERTPDRAPPEARGAGTREAPHVVPALPFSDLRAAGPATTATYTGCDGGGPTERVYRVELDHAQRVWMLALRSDGTMPLHVLDGAMSRCIAGGDGEVEVELAPGRYHVAVGGPPGDDTLLVIEPVPGPPPARPR